MSSSSNRVLVIEDDRKISLALSIRLKSEGYDVLQAYDGRSGVAIAATQRPDVIVLDVRLPKDDGFGVAAKINQLSTTSGTPIVFVTASRESGLKDKARLLGAAAFLEKPYDARELINAVADAANGDTALASA